jgi:release factor glutamine methyltransferase
LNSVDNVYFVSGDLFKPFKLDSFACITANPPYISKDEINLLPPNIREYEPEIALNGGKEGLQFYRRIIKEVKKYILKNGLIFLESGINQAKYVGNMAENEGLEIVDTVKDLAGIERVVILKRG